ncbi:GntR family transcriptional regulator [Acetobacteraceae bacterium H6797]|nr:GntR family transcriptional regulator [Acetobacteraceae bacterium H6797]
MADTAYEAIADLLASGRVAPGERLSLRDMAEALGVSVMPVREAVSRLIADQALEVAPNRAVRVPIMTAKAFRELARIRAEVEGFAAAEAALRREAADLDAIAEAEAAFRQEGFLNERASDRAVPLNRDVHFAIYRAARMPLLMQMIGGLWLKAGPVINLDLRDSPERLNKGHARECHAAAWAAIEARDPAAAREAIARDITLAADYIIGRGGLPSG